MPPKTLKKRSVPETKLLSSPKRTKREFQLQTNLQHHRTVGFGAPVTSEELLEKLNTSIDTIPLHYYVNPDAAKLFNYVKVVPFTPVTNMRISTT